jgi:SNF2 family DNA or RNA helicase
LRRRYPELHYLGGGISDKRARETIARWNRGELTQLALHPASAGHGLNLQKSGAHHIAFLTLPWSGGMYKQVIGRLARRGQIAKQIFVHTALFSDTIDETVFGVVTGKLTGMESFLNDLEAIGAGD